jgi:trimethylamine:corrinoid methyltransferase-like protein
VGRALDRARRAARSRDRVLRDFAAPVVAKAFLEALSALPAR